MKTEKRIFKNTLALTLGKVFGDLATFLFLVYFARIFGISIFGQYAFAMALGGFLSILVSLGLNILVVREISQDKSNDAKYIGNMLATQCVLAMLSWSLIGIFVLLSNFDDQASSIILIIGAYQILYKLTQLIHVRFKAHEHMEYSAFLEIYHKVVILIFGSLFIVLWENPAITLLVYPISALSMFLIGITISSHKYGRPEFKVNFPFIKELLSKSLPFLILSILAIFYDRIGIILLTSMQGNEATGIYAATDRFLMTIISGIGMFGSALFPIISRFANESRQKLVITYERSVRIILVTVLPIATFLYLLSEQIILFIYGEEFSESAPVLKILCWVILPAGLSVILALTLVAIDQQKEIARIQLMIFSGFFIACIILIPLYSYTGLAYTKLVTSSVLCLAYIWHLSKTLHQSPLVTAIKAPLIACLATIIVFNLMLDQGIWLSTPTAMLTCIITLFLTGGIKSYDLHYIKNILLEKR